MFFSLLQVLYFCISVCIIDNCKPFLEDMNHQAILENLLELLAASHITIRREPMGGGGGGLCQLKDKKVFFLDTQTGSYESAAQAAKAVWKVIEDPEAIFLMPAVRDFLDRFKEIE